jgi:hypothetical protein
MQIDDTLDYLTGSWVLERVIADHRIEATGFFGGVGELRTVGRRGRYEERGRLTFGGYDGTAYRTLDLIAADNGVVAVHFADGRPFFDLELQSGLCRAAHPCNPDRYEFEFEIGAPDLLLERWRVTGPMKDYEAQTTWRRH